MPDDAYTELTGSWVSEDGRRWLRLSRENEASDARFSLEVFDLLGQLQNVALEGALTDTSLTFELGRTTLDPDYVLTIVRTERDGQPHLRLHPSIVDGWIAMMASGYDEEERDLFYDQAHPLTAFYRASPQEVADWPARAHPPPADPRELEERCLDALEALRRHARTTRRSATAVEKASQAQSALAEMLGAVLQRRTRALAACGSCSPGQPPRWPSPVSGRFKGDVRCRECETVHRIEAGYEYLVGGSEDWREARTLDPACLLATVARAIAGDERPTETAVDELEAAIRSVDLTPAAAAARSELRRRLEGEPHSLAWLHHAAIPLLRPQHEARRDCVVCRRIQPHNSVGSRERYIIRDEGDTGRRACARCGTVYWCTARGALVDGGWTLQRWLGGDLLSMLRANACTWPSLREELHRQIDEASFELRCPRPQASLPPIHFFVAHDRVSDVGWLLTPSIDADERDSFDWTPLMRAAHKGFLGCARVLLERGASVTARNAVGETALFVAAEAGQLEMVELLLQAGSDPAVRSRGRTRRARRLGVTGEVARRGTSALDRALAFGHHEVAALLRAAL